MPDPRHDPDREDRDRNRVTAADVGTATSASVDGRAAEDLEPSTGITAAGGAAGGAVAAGTAGLVMGGPIGAAIGAIAGAIGGGWLGLASGRHGEHVYQDHHDAEYRRHFESDEQRLADRTYDDTRVAYQLGHFAAANPDYEGRAFEEVESDVRRGWTPELQAHHGSWEQARRYAQFAFRTRRGQSQGSTFVDLDMGGTESHRRASFNDPIPPGDPDAVAGPGPIPGRDD